MGFSVLLYHRVHPRFGVRPEEFRKQMELLKRNFRVLSMDDLRKGKFTFPSVLITFDDGFYDVFLYAYPVLKELSIPAVVFVSPERVYDSEEVRNDPEKSNVSTYDAFKNSFTLGASSAFLSWGELKVMMDIFDVQSHALTHSAAKGEGKPFKPDRDWRIYSVADTVQEGEELTSVLVVDYRRAYEELIASKRLIEEKLGNFVDAVAWPWGVYSQELISLARKLGYRFCFTSERGWNRGDFCRIKRISVNERKSLFWLKSRTLFYAF